MHNKKIKEVKELEKFFPEACAKAKKLNPQYEETKEEVEENAENICKNSKKITNEMVLKLLQLSPNAVMYTVFQNITVQKLDRIIFLEKILKDKEDLVEKVRQKNGSVDVTINNIIENIDIFYNLFRDKKIEKRLENILLLSPMEVISIVDDSADSKPITYREVVEILKIRVAG